MTFAGFSPTGLAFLANLAQNNNRDWFQAHRDVHQTALLEPALAFVVTLGERLREIAPHFQFDTHAKWLSEADMTLATCYQ